MTRSTLLALTAIGALGLLSGIRLLHGAPNPQIPDVRAPGEEETDPIDGGALDPLYSKELAKAKLATYSSDLKQLAREKLQVARDAYESRFKEFLAGRGTLDFLLASSLRLLESAQALAATQEERLALLEIHWQRMATMESVNRARYEAGRIPISDYAESKYFRLQAEIWLVEARAKGAKK
jgi:hypothetical protein